MRGEHDTSSPGGGLPSLHVRPILVVLALKTALNLAFANRYGWHRDELYYAIAGRHLQGGYVEFPPVTALFSAFAHLLFGFSLTGFRLFTILAGAATALIAALVSRELGGGRRAQVIATVVVAFSPLLVATNGLFQPVSFDQLTTMLFLWLALRLALGRGSWPLIGLVAGVGLETKYTLGVVIVLTFAAFLLLRRDALSVGGLAVAAAIAAAIVAPNLVWEARHGWISVHWFLDPPASASDESRIGFVANSLLLTHPLAIPVAVAGVLHLWRSRALRVLAVALAATWVAYFFLGGKSYYALPVIMFALACGAVPFDRRVSTRRLRILGGAFAGLLVVMLPIGLPVLPLHTADALGVLKARSDYPDEVGWPALVRQVAAHAAGADVVLAENYGEAGALDVFGAGTPPVASGHVTFRYWRPAVAGENALLVGFTERRATFCRAYVVVAHVAMPVDNEERGQEIARCRLTAPLPQVWPQILALYG